MRGKKKEVIDGNVRAERIARVKALISQKWYLTIEELGARVHVSKETIGRALKGHYIGEKTEKKLIEYLENYEGE